MLVAHHVPWFVLGAVGILTWPWLASRIERRRRHTRLTGARGTMVAQAARDLRASLAALEARRVELAQQIVNVELTPAARIADALEPLVGRGSRTEAGR